VGLNAIQNAELHMHGVGVVVYRGVRLIHAKGNQLDSAQRHRVGLNAIQNAELQMHGVGVVVIVACG
jgi:hypothetical protein